MKYSKILLTFIILCNFSLNASSTSIEVSGWIDVNATWDVDTVKLVGDFTIKDGAKLTITAGTRIESYGMYGIEVRGSLIAIGTAQDNIIFTSADTTDFYATLFDDGGWRGIYFLEAITDKGIMINKIIKL